MNGHLDDNLAALRERCPDFLAWWEKCPSQPGEYNLLSSLSGLPDLEIERPGGQRIILYNRENPFETIQKDLADQSFPKGSLTFLFGLGLGYRALHILSAMEPGHTVYIVERDPDILRLALALHDYSAEIRNGNIIFAVPEKQALRQIIQEKNSILLTGRIRLFLDDFTRRLDSATVILHDTCLRQTNAIRVNYNTVIQEGGKIIQNELDNLPKTILGWSPEGLLNGAFRNRPAIIVATGPSLQKNITLLREAQGKALIIAVAQALRVLLAYDVRPDVLCSIDFGEPNYLEMKDSLAVADTPLLISPQIFPQIPREYQGDLFVTMDRNNLLCTSGSDLPAFLGHGLTVAQIALNLALMAGADPIIFAGQDLAFGESSHISGVWASRRVKVQGNSVIAEHENGDHEQTACWVPGYYGKRVLTNTSLFAFLEGIETKIRDYPERRFINATEGGAHISGTERMPLCKVLETHCRQEFPVAELLANARIPLGSDPERLSLELEESRRHLNRLLRYVENLEQMTGKMKALLQEKREKEQPQRIDQLNGLNRKVLNVFSSVLQALDESRLIRLATVKIRRNLIMIGEQSPDMSNARDVAVQTIQFCEELCSGLRDICPPLMEKIDFIHPVLKEFATVSAAAHTIRAEGDAKSKLHLRRGLCLQRMGDLVKASAALEAAAANDSCRIPALETLFTLYLDLNRFDKAEACLGRFPDGYPHQATLMGKLGEIKKQDREHLLEHARLSLERDDFAGCITACRTFVDRHGESPETSAMLDRSLNIRERKSQAARRQVLEEQEAGRLQHERDQLLQSAFRKMEEKDYAAALALYRELAQAEPENEDFARGAAVACQRLNDWEGAERELSMLTGRHPENGLYFRDLGNVLLYRGKPNEALENYRKAIEREPSAQGLSLQIASVLSSFGMVADAVSFYERHMKDYPNDYRALVMWGDCFLRLGIGAAAKLSWETALRIRPGYSPAVERLERLQPAVNS